MATKPYITELVAGYHAVFRVNVTPRVCVWATRDEADAIKVREALNDAHEVGRAEGLEDAHLGPVCLVCSGSGWESREKILPCEACDGVGRHSPS
jgi:hypothetical protein